MTRTSSAFEMSLSTTCDPMNPAPPARLLAGRSKLYGARIPMAAGDPSDRSAASTGLGSVDA
jgi:hypothetical protein